ncbi:Rec8 like protein-domain-containing protein [Astrocystis sublimbata]|nr:Rec8 like protein-domain-containing protein [Astrocystis sublimbata]
MFYSHEILTSRQYGVATVWLVATIGNRSGTRKVGRKAIQEVDVQRACGKILEPGAPIALRLQGNLLYGVARVYNQQCTYLVTDAKKIQDQMRIFLTTFSGNQLDPEAGKTRREDILILNDPAFDPRMPLPKFELEALVSSQSRSQKTSSQMSPQGSQPSSFGSPGEGFAIQLDIDDSGSSGHRGSPFGLGGVNSAQKHDDERLISHQEGDDIFGTHGDWGLEIDENGNIVESAGPLALEEEPQLPPLPRIRGDDSELADAAQLDEQPVFDDQGDVIMQENTAPVAEAKSFRERQVHLPLQDEELRAAHAPPRRGRRKVRIDEKTQVPRNAIRDWQTGYLEVCGGRPRGFASVGWARNNAMLLTFGLGIGNIGQSIGVPGLVHPLAIDFSGDALFTAVTRIEVVKKARGRRRGISEVNEEDEPEDERRVRPRLMDNGEEKERARGSQADDFMAINDTFADDNLQEVGREAEHPMSDHLSSTMLPWNRGSSAVPGSSTRALNPVQQGRDLSSPLGKQSQPQDIVRYSDDAPMGDLGSDGHFDGGFGSGDSSFDGMQDPELMLQGDDIGADPMASGTQTQNNALLAQLDREGFNFMNFIRDVAAQDGERRKDEDYTIDRRWLAFDDLFVPRSTPRSTAAQAFYHTLSLVTKGKMYVEQDDAEHQAFGAIWVGVKADAGDI